VLIAQTKFVNGRLVAPPESIDALKKYPELASDGGHTAKVKQKLEYAATGR
jgi:hypothetical protein